MNFEHHRKAAKRLVHGFRAGDARGVARAEGVLGERARGRFGLSDAQHVIAVELGYQSWRQLLRAARQIDAEQPGAALVRYETGVDTGLRYRPEDPVCVLIVRRERRLSVTDDGAAIAKTGRPPRWREVRGSGRAEA